ncbi:MAG: HNH endonuclease [Caldilinea sp. CFX5]|nr:HNH endonuclease [Caldilinea sp. CFX5]
MAYVSPAVRQVVAIRAGYCCEYCQSAERVTSGPMHVEHILPTAKGGVTDPDNLAYPCARCNLHKGMRTAFHDPVSGRSTPLFNPRFQVWSDHFLWSGDKTRILGLTPSGRATIVALQMNDPVIVMSRSLWVSLGIHPPPDELRSA